MALLADKTTTKKLESRLSEFTEYGMTLYYLFEEGRTNLKDLENIFFSKDDEKSSFIYGKIVKHMKPSDLKKSFEKYSITYPKEETKDETIYKKDLNLLFTKKIIDLVINETNEIIDKTYVSTYKYLLANIKNK